MNDIGKHFIVGVQGVELTAAERSLWKELRPLGVIIFRRNISKEEHWRDDLKRLISELRALSGRAEFIASIDHEGGRVHRLSPPVTQFPAAQNWRDYSYEVGAAMGSELAGLGINLNFAPSFDVLTEPKNTVIGARSFSSNPEEVSKRALAFLDGLESQAVLGCAKHFPGHGGTLADSHHELPRVDTPREILEKQELVPFKNYIASGRKLIMTAHVVYKALDPKNPATLSRDILTDLLRHKLGFDGAIITDALDMGALSGINENEVAKKFVQAGGDIFCVCQDTNDKNASGEKISPIQSAKLYADALSSSDELITELSRSTKAIDCFIKQLKLISAGVEQKDRTTNFEKHSQLVKLIADSNA